MVVNYQLKAPGATGENGPIYVRAPKMLEAKLRDNLGKPMGELIKSGDKVDFTDPMLNGVSLAISFDLTADKEAE